MQWHGKGVNLCTPGMSGDAARYFGNSLQMMDVKGNYECPGTASWLGILFILGGLASEPKEALTHVIFSLKGQ